MNDIGIFFNPKSIALVGASPLQDKLGSVLLNSLIKRFNGCVYPVNPKYKNIDNLRCYANIKDVAECIDISILIVPSGMVLQALNDGVEAGVKGVVIISAGFKETGSHGASMEKEIKGIVESAGIRVVGPNCMGIYDSLSGVDTFFIPEERLERPHKGGLSIVSQSGSFAVSIMDSLAMEGIGVARVVNYGNMVDANESDFLEYLADDEETKVIALYIEAVEDGRRFIEAAKRCRGKKPVIAIKVGKYSTGAHAAMSHTGAIAGRHEIYSAAFKKAAVIEVAGYNGLIDACKVFSMQGRAQGKRVFILTDGGGIGVSLADSCVEMGLDAVALPDILKTDLREKLPPFCSIANPFDLTGSVTDNGYRIALQESIKHFDIAIVAALWGPPGLTDKLVHYIKDISVKSKKPIIICSPGGRYTQEKKRLFESCGLPVFSTPEDAVRAAEMLTRRQ